jgi:hypothetical protein
MRDLVETENMRTRKVVALCTQAIRKPETMA